MPCSCICFRPGDTFDPTGIFVFRIDTIDQHENAYRVFFNWIKRVFSFLLTNDPWCISRNLYLLRWWVFLLSMSSSTNPVCTRRPIRPCKSSVSMKATFKFNYLLKFPNSFTEWMATKESNEVRFYSFIHLNIAWKFNFSFIQFRVPLCWFESVAPRAAVISCVFSPLKSYGFTSPLSFTMSLLL